MRTGFWREAKNRHLAPTVATQKPLRFSSVTRSHTMISYPVWSVYVRQIILTGCSTPVTAGTGREFFLDINQRHLTHLQFRLTDSRNRPIGRKLSHHTSRTASGTGTEQSTLGNLEFSACVRIDIIKKRQANEFATSKYQPTVPARFSGGVVNQFPNEHI